MNDLGTALIHLQCELVAERTTVNPKNISWLQYDILLQLENQNQLLPSVLSNLLGISRTKLSKSLKNLKSLGYIEQQSSVSDGRERYTFISPSGKKLLSDISIQHEHLFKIASSCLTTEEQEQFTLLSIKVSNALQAERRGTYE